MPRIILTIGRGTPRRSAGRRRRRAALMGMWSAGLCVLAVCVVGAPSAAGADAAPGVEALVSTESPATSFYQTDQDEPAIAIDPVHPNVLAVGANDSIDVAACNVGEDRICQLEGADQAGVGQSGVYFSTDTGQSWTQPVYQGRTARDCLGVAGIATDTCSAHRGPIGTLPHFDEHGLWSLGDPGVAFGPTPGPNGFSWSNGSRLYYSTLATNLPGSRAIKSTPQSPFPLAVAVSRIDGDPATGLTPVDLSDGNRWMAPVLASGQDSTQISDKDQIWADNASSSPYFGNAYVCFGRFQIGPTGHYSEALEVATSSDGGDTWTTRKVTQQDANPHVGIATRAGCTIRTDSQGAVYLFFEERSAPGQSHGNHVLIRSLDGGTHWTKPRVLFQAVGACVDDGFGGCTEDGVSGARAELSSSPSISIANGAPTGAGASNLIVDSWADGRDGINHSHVLVTASSNGGGSWSPPVAVEQRGDHSLYSAIAISPDASDVYLVYIAFTTPFRGNTTDPRELVGQVLHAAASAGVVGRFSPVHRGSPGDPRGSSCPCFGEEFLGDYVYAAATNSYGAAAWTDVRNAADCPAIDAFRALGEETPLSERPAPMAGDCPTTFGNTDIYSWTSTQ